MKQLKKNSLDASWAFLIDSDIHGDDDEVFKERIATREEFNFLRLELEKTTKHQPESRIAKNLSRPKLSSFSLELKTLQKSLLTIIFDMDPNKIMTFLHQKILNSIMQSFSNIKKLNLL